MDNSPEVAASDPVTVGLVPDDLRQQEQVLVSTSELLVMRTMVGGVCLLNWLRLRGLIDEPGGVKES